VAGIGGGYKIFELLEEELVTLYQIKELLMLALYGLVVLLQVGDLLPELQVFPAQSQAFPVKAHEFLFQAAPLNLQLFFPASKLLGSLGIGFLEAVAQDGLGLLHHQFLIQAAPTFESQANIGHVMETSAVFAVQGLIEGLESFLSNDIFSRQLTP
jgi:hypothetical protein